MENWARFLPEATVIREVAADSDGYVNLIDGEALGLAVVALGGGRQRENDEIDPAVGLSNVAQLGEKVKRGQPVVTIHAARETSADQVEAVVRNAIKISGAKPKVPDLIRERTI